MLLIDRCPTDNHSVSCHLRLYISNFDPPNPYTYPSFSTTTMGQYWRLLNLVKRQTPSQGNWGKLGECLFDGSPDILIPLLKRVFDVAPHANSDSALPLKMSWAGDRIICLGDYHEDLPAGMLSISEQAELDKADDGKEMSLYEFADQHYQYAKGINTFNSPQLSGGHWILRNLSKYEYVREEAIKVARGKG